LSASACLHDGEIVLAEFSAAVNPESMPVRLEREIEFVRLVVNVLRGLAQSAPPPLLGIASIATGL
jgi:hypothetical protein